MSIKIVKFIGRDIEISDQLPRYVAFLEQFEGYGNELYAFVTKQAKEGKYTWGTEESFVEWRRPIQGIAEKVIKSGTDFGIYDLTIADLVDRNPGVSQLHDVCKETMEKLIDNLKKAFQDFRDGLERAERQADASITGSGVSIWTNSLSSALVFGALEMSTVKKQYNKADKEYRLAIDDLCRRNDDSHTQGEKRILTQIYYPGCNAAISVIISHMLKTYLTKVCQTSDFDYAEVQSYNMAESVEIVKNLSLVPDKEEVIVKAFERCPYNPDVFKGLIDIDLVDFDTFDVAKYLSQNTILLPFIIEYTKTKVRAGQDCTEAVRIWASFEGIDELEVYNLLFLKKFTILSRYGEVVNAIYDVKSSVKWITDHIADKSSDLISKKSTIPSVIEHYVKSILNNITFTKLRELGILKVQDFNLTGDETADYEAIIDDLSKKLSKRVIAIVANIEKKVSELSVEVSRLKSEENKLRHELLELENSLQNRIDDLQTKRNNCGLFDFSKKKELDQAIKTANEEKAETLTAKEKAIDSIVQKKKMVEERMEFVP